ncbi:MAG: hypothetical protein WCQ99_06485 [Pseudomonadota bacterium]
MSGMIIQKDTNHGFSRIVCINDLSERHKPKSEEKTPGVLDDIRKIMEPGR